jgi:hypothetical protein
VDVFGIVFPNNSLSRSFLQIASIKNKAWHFS